MDLQEALHFAMDMQSEKKATVQFFIPRMRSGSSFRIFVSSDFPDIKQNAQFNLLVNRGLKHLHYTKTCVGMMLKFKG